MKYLLMCEGSNEELLINLLLDMNALILTREDLIGRKPYHIRQITHPTIVSELKLYNKSVTIYRIGDKQTDKLTIPIKLKNIVSQDRIYKYCTKPELEILLIINEGLFKKYQKIKSKKTPKEFAKENITFNGIKYDQSCEFLNKYYSNKNIKKLINNLKEYKLLNKKHNKDELYLADLIKGKK